MKASAKLKGVKFDLSRYEKELQRHFSRVLAEAAELWIGKTTALIPVWSGASLATFQPLASQFGLPLSISPVTTPTRIALGLTNGTGTATSGGGKFSFEYSTTLDHLIYNEFNNANVTPDPTLFARLLTPGPYRFQEAGAVALEGLIDTVRPPDFLTFFKIVAL